MEGVRPCEPSRQSRTAAARARATHTVLAVTLMALSPLAQAQSFAQESAYGLSGRIGMGLSTLPTYEGSANRRTLVAPELTLRYRTHEWGTVVFDPRGLLWDAYEAGQFRFAVVAVFDPGRKDKDTSTFNLTPGDKRLAGMGDIPVSTEAGVGIGYGPLMLQARQSLSEKGSKGAQVELTLGIPWSVSDRLGLNLSLGATWANKDYMQTHFGVTAAQAQATSFSAYTPKSGYRKMDASVAAEYAIAADWTLLANVGFTRLGGNAAASPLVSRRASASAALSVAYEF